MTTLNRCALALLVVSMEIWATETARSQESAQSAVVTFDSHQTLLVFMTPEEADQVLADHRSPFIDPTSAAEVAVVGACSEGAEQLARTPKGLTELFSKRLVQALLLRAGDRVRQALEQYGTIVSQSASIDYYAPQSSSNTDRVQARHSCFRFAQGELTTNGNIEVSFDFVARAKVADSRDAVLLEPLRLFIARPAVKSRDKSLGVALGVRGEAVWRDAVRGYKETVWDEVVLTERVDLTSGPALKYYVGSPQPAIRLPMPPMSAAVDFSRPFGRIAVTVNAAQAGAVPASLDLLADALLPSRDRAAGLLYEAVAARSAPP